MTEYSDQVEAAAEAAWTRAQALLADMEGVGQGERVPANRVRRWAKRLAECLDALEAEGAMLSAGVCPHVQGDEHGHAICGRDGSAL